MDLHMQMATKNPCYRNGTIHINGICVHSTGCNNPNLRRYVGPDDGLLGPSSSVNWNLPTASCQVHTFIGKLYDGSIATYQVLPWNKKAWHCGLGTSGKSANSSYISFEICEDTLANETYFKTCYKEAVELCTYLCQKYDLDPVTQIYCHSELYEMGIASNHADIMHWFKRYHKTMDDFRKDVKQQIEDEEDDDMTQDKFNEMMNTWMNQQAAIDMPSTSVLCGELKEAKDMGITDGTAPYKPVTRAQAAVMCIRAVKAIKK